MANINLPGFSGVSRYSSNPIPTELFGANFLFDRDGGQEAGTISNTYHSFVNEVNLQTIRYPGGTITEVNLDLTDPNSENHNYMGLNDTRAEPTVGVTDFVNFAKEVGASVTFVLPTYRFLSVEPDQGGSRAISSDQEPALRSFVRFVLQEASANSVSIDAFEIGNEWYVDNSAIFGFRMSPVEYGRVASYLAVVVQEEISNFNYSLPEHQSNSPAIVVQVGPGGQAEWYTPSGEIASEDYEGRVASATQLIFNQFDSLEARSAIDGLVSHRYMHGEDSMIDGWSYDPFKQWIRMADATSGFGQFELYVTEWNVSARNQTELGLKQFDTMIELIEEMAIAGVDHANVWAVQQRNDTRLIENSGLGDRAYRGLSFAGVAFDMMASQLPGTQVIDGASSIQALAVNSFGSSERNVYFLTNRSEVSRSDSILMSSVEDGAHHVSIYEITEAANGRPTVTVTTLNLEAGVRDIKIEFSGNESVMVVIAKGDAGVEIEGYDQSDTLSGSRMADLMSGGANGDSIYGDRGSDQLLGETGNDTVRGGDGGDTIFGGEGADLLDGGVGDDVLYGGTGDDLVFGGAGVDVASYASASVDLVIGLVQDPLSVAGLGTDILFEIEGLEGGSGNDSISGDESSNILIGGDGQDWLWGDVGDDTLLGGVGCDTLTGGTGFDLASHSGAASAVLVDLASAKSNTGEARGDSYFGIEGLEGSNFGDTLYGDFLCNLLIGLGGNDRLDGRTGNDTLVGGEGNDTLIGGAGSDRLDGGTGSDFASYAEMTVALRVDLSNPAQSSGAAALDVLVGIENLIGGTAGDTLFGDGGANRLFGEAGNDRLEGRAGADVLDGGTGNDVLDGGADKDRLLGGDGNDVLVGGARADWLEGGAGFDRLEGGTGFDLASHSGAASAVLVDLASAKSNTGEARGDSYSGIEGLEGSNFGDTLFGDSLGNLMIGLGGNDRLGGRTGNDTLVGGEGNDTLIGGAGSDVFVFNRSGGAGNVDRIKDFNVISDTINLDDLAFAGLAAGTLAVSAFASNLTGLATDGLDRLIYESDTGNLYFDADGSGVGLRVQFATLAANLSLTNADFFVF